jgi:hypothetical protein
MGSPCTKIGTLRRELLKLFVDLRKWLERLPVNANVAAVLGSIPASSDTAESEMRQMQQR